MNVNAIRDRIVELSHQSAGDGEVQGKALGWLNAAYHEVMDEILPYAPSALQVQENAVADALGAVVLAQAPYMVVGVVNRDTGRMLERAGKADVLAADPTGSATGEPRLFVVTGTGLSLWPAGAATVGVVYIPAVADLLDNGAESSVLLPKAHHGALVWGGLVWSSLFERGFGTQGEMLMFQRQWADAKERVKLALVGNAGLRVTSW